MQAAGRARGVLLAALLAVAGACGGNDAAPAGAGAASSPAGFAAPSADAAETPTPALESAPSADAASLPAGSADSASPGSRSAAPSVGAAGSPPSVGPPDGARPNGVVPAPELPAPRPPAAVPDELSSPDHRRYQQLRVETLRLLIEAARRALPIAGFQQRIDAAARTALQDVSEAADRMEETAADLRAALAAADPAGR